LTGRISHLRALDIRFPTSRTLAGSDAMNAAPDYSACYVILETDRDDGVEGHGLAFTIGRGTEVVVAAAEALRPLVVGTVLDEITGDMRGFWRRVTGESQLRWLGPEKGVVHLAAAAVVNAVWDLWAKLDGKPLWELLSDMTAEEIVACVDFRYIEDVITPDAAVDLLRGREEGSAARRQEMRDRGFPAYTTSPGWLGYDDAELRRLCREAVSDGWTHLKLKVGADPETDLRRAMIAREEIGPDRTLMLDANQVWGVEQAIANMERLAACDPWWIEEPTSPDDVLGHAAIARAVAPVGVATGEHAHNRVMFKQLMQAEAISFCQIDACRLAGVNEVIAVLLMAAKFDIPVCPHAGGVGLCEYVQHLSIFDYVRVSGSLAGRVVEYVDHLHEHFLDPVVIRDNHYIAPTAPGYSAAMHPESLATHAYPDGAVWRRSSEADARGASYPPASRGRASV
jgi:L-fuconate dehydratase